MPFRSITDPEQVAILTAILDELCYDTGIEVGSQERDEAAILLVSLYWGGYRTIDELKKAFAARLDPDIRRLA